MGQEPADNTIRNFILKMKQDAFPGYWLGKLNVSEPQWQRGLTAVNY
jgi:hypothetical protein